MPRRRVSTAQMYEMTMPSEKRWKNTSKMLPKAKKSQVRQWAKALWKEQPWTEGEKETSPSQNRAGRKVRREEFQNRIDLIGIPVKSVSQYRERSSAQSIMSQLPGWRKIQILTNTHQSQEKEQKYSRMTYREPAGHQRGYLQAPWDKGICL